MVIASVFVPLSVHPFAENALPKAVGDIPPPRERIAELRFALFVVEAYVISLPADAGEPNCHAIICACPCGIALPNRKAKNKNLRVNNFYIDRARLDRKKYSTFK